MTHSYTYERQSIYSDAAEVLIGLDDSRPYSIVDIPAQHALAAATLQGLANSSHLWQLDYFMAQVWISRVGSRHGLPLQQIKALSEEILQKQEQSFFNFTRQPLIWTWHTNGTLIIQTDCD